MSGVADACQGKVAFASRALATKVAKRRRRARSGDSDRGSAAYHCAFCGKYHIGYKSKRRA